MSQEPWVFHLAVDVTVNHHCFGGVIVTACGQESCIDNLAVTVANASN